MPATKIQMQQRLTAAKAIIADNGGQAHIDNLPREESAPLHRQMVDALMEKFAHEQVTKRTAERYIGRALAQFRGEKFHERRGGSRGGGLPEGSRKCQNCNKWHVAIDPEDAGWACPDCGAVHYPRRRFLQPGDVFRIDWSFQDAVDNGLRSE